MEAHLLQCQWFSVLLRLRVAIVLETSYRRAALIAPPLTLHRWAWMWMLMTRCTLGHSTYLFLPPQPEWSPMWGTIYIIMYICVAFYCHDHEHPRPITHSCLLGITEKRLVHPWNFINRLFESVCQPAVYGIEVHDLIGLGFGQQTSPKILFRSKAGNERCTSRAQHFWFCLCLLAVVGLQKISENTMNMEWKDQYSKSGGYFLSDKERNSLIPGITIFLRAAGIESYSKIGLGKLGAFFPCILLVGAVGFKSVIASSSYSF